MRDTNGSRSEHHLLSCVSQMLNKPNSAETAKERIETVLCCFPPQVFTQVSLPFFFCPPQSLSLSHSLTTPPLPSLHSSSSLSGEEKQTAVRVRLADEFQMTLKGRGADQLSPEETLVTNMRACAWIQAHKQRRINMAHSSKKKQKKTQHLPPPHPPIPHSQKQSAATPWINTVS